MRSAELLDRWLARQLPADAAAWLQQSAAKLQAGAQDRDLYLAVSLATRKVGKDDLRLEPGDLRDANAARPGWDPRGWSAEQAARVRLLLGLESDPARLARCLDQLCITGDVAELAAFYRGLPLYPEAPRYLARATEGLRTNMKSVFESIAHRNPYPSEQFPEAAWNQMVLKTLFIGSTLGPIVGLDTRTNPALARMLLDYAHERWAASRPVSPELWRCIGPQATGAAVQDLEKVLKQGTEPERKAAALALRASPDPAAAAALQRDPGLARLATEGKLSWDALGA